jgi:hypothetical protein
VNGPRRPEGGESLRGTLESERSSAERDPAEVENGGRSGPAVARLFQRLLALMFLAAWVSLGVQLDELIGSRGLLPIERFLDGIARPTWRTAWNVPTLFWLGAGDAVLHAGVALGIALSVAAFAGVRARLCFALATILYLSYVTAGRTFFSFQWDNLLLECGFLAVFLPAHRPARWIHVLFRVLLFKLYWESGVAKWQSALHDWHDGSAMSFYYETAPLPTWLAWYAHALPLWWHRLESWGALFMELAVPLAFFGPRPARLFAFAVLTGFQAVNAATANYGFFVHLSVSLHVFLLGDRDVVRARKRLRAMLPARLRWSKPPGEVLAARPPGRRLLRIAGATLVVTLFIAVSAADGLLRFGGAGPWRQSLSQLASFYRPWRLINTYHLFAHITRERIEPEFQVASNGAWTPLSLHYKPGDTHAAPSFVAPHQPRVDFQLWFYGLGYRRGTPEYVAMLLRRLCHDPEAVAGLFLTPLPSRPEATRIAFWQYHFTTPEERLRSGAWWRRRFLGTTPPTACASSPPSRGGSR